MTFEKVIKTVQFAVNSDQMLINFAKRVKDFHNL